MSVPRGIAVALAASLASIPICISYFATGFFPYKPFLPGHARYDDASQYGEPPAAPFDKVVFMVVDALRSDFVYLPGTGFEFTQSLIRDGAAIPFTAHATAPTITMPRIKAMTTGSIPSFLDLILNFDEADKTSSLATQDTWLAQLKARQTGKLVMYGDDTWLKLFPETFDRADGTSSFFVADFTEVDNNVTRHIPEELKKDDWSGMVMHYLGLDHIGHKTGPKGPNMLTKQREMDRMVRDVYTAMETEAHLQSALFIVCGDHGMNDAGNHGASSPGETSPALVFISPKLKSLGSEGQPPREARDDFQYYGMVEQSDMVPTLAALLGFPVPKNNLGAIIPDFLPLWTRSDDKLQLLSRNAHQILGIVTSATGDEQFDPVKIRDACANPDSDLKKLACEWTDVAERATAQASKGGPDSEWIERISVWLKRAQVLMSGIASNYNMPRLFIGISIASTALLLAIGSSLYALRGETLATVAPFATMTLAYGGMMFASSYVEEEQQFWYWASSAWFVWTGIRATRGKSDKEALRKFQLLVLILVSTRLVRAWNQTGQKFAGAPDLVKLFLEPRPNELWVFVGLTYLWEHGALLDGYNAAPKIISVGGMTGLILMAFIFKLAFAKEDAPELVIGWAARVEEVAAGTPLLARARALFVALGIAAGAVFFYGITRRKLSTKTPVVETLHHLYTILAMTQSRLTNIPLFLVYNLQQRFLQSSVDLSVAEIATVSLLLQYTSFFAAGGTNAISSVDLSSAYNGVSNFNVLAVGVLTFVSNWAGSIWWSFAAVVLLLKKRTQLSQADALVKRGTGKEAPASRDAQVFLGYASLLTVFTTCSLVFVMVACMVLRTHLFIWTVFSPKFLYCMAWSLGQHMLINIGLGGLLYWFGTLDQPR